jgi:hypothetical protein
MLCLQGHAYASICATVTLWYQCSTMLFVWLCVSVAKNTILLIYSIALPKPVELVILYWKIPQCLLCFLHCTTIFTAEKYHNTGNATGKFMNWMSLTNKKAQNSVVFFRYAKQKYSSTNSRKYNIIVLFYSKFCFSTHEASSFPMHTANNTLVFWDAKSTNSWPYWFFDKFSLRPITIHNNCICILRNVLQLKLIKKYINFLVEPCVKI